MKINFKHQTSKAVPGVSCSACVMPRELCGILSLSGVCCWYDFKNCSQSGVFNL